MEWDYMMAYNTHQLSAISYMTLSSMLSLMFLVTQLANGSATTSSTWHVVSAVVLLFIYYFINTEDKNKTTIKYNFTIQNQYHLLLKY